MGLFPIALLAAAALGRPGVCTPDPATALALRRVEDIEARCGDAPACLAERQRQLEDALATRPDDVHLQRARLQVLRMLSLDKPGRLLELYPITGRSAALLAAPRSRALALDLRGLALRRTLDERRSVLEEALRLDRSLPWPHLDLGDVPHLRAFLAACPEAIGGLEAAARVDAQAPPEALELAREWAPRLRARLEQGQDPRAWPALWGAEFALVAPQQHEAVRARIRADLEQIRSRPQPDRLVYWETLAEGSQLVGDSTARVLAEIESRFPCSEPALQEHLGHLDRGAGDRAVYDATTGWLRQCPGVSALAVERFFAAKRAAGLSDDDVLDAADTFLAAQHTDFRTRTPVPSVQVVELLLARGLRETAIPGLLRTAAEEVETAHRLALARGGSAAQSADRLRADNLFRVRLVTARAEISAGRLASARAILDEIAPPEPQDETARFPAQRWREERAKLAEKEDRLLDALVDWRAASALGGDTRARARGLWERLGGSEASFAEFWGSPEAAALAPPEGPFTASVGRPLPAFSLPDLAGRTWTPRDLDGRVAVLTTWATWCEPCKLEMPWLQRFAQQAGAGVVVLTLNVDENQGLVAPFAKANGLEMPVLQAGSLKLDVEGIPTTWIVDRKGVVRHQSTGFGDGQAWLDELRKLVGALSAEP
jgi:thiol-disulfide isomerase/thioredoxin